MLAKCLTKIHDSMWRGEKAQVFKCENGIFRLSKPTIRRGLTTLYASTDYVRLTSLNLHYLARIFYVVQQHLRYYMLAMPDLLS